MSNEGEIVFAKVRQVTPREDKILVPLSPIGDTHFQATIAYDLAQLGIPFKTIKFYNDVAERNGLKSIREYVECYGRRIYGSEIDPFNNQFVGFETVPISEQK